MYKVLVFKPRSKLLVDSRSTTLFLNNSHTVNKIRDHKLKVKLIKYKYCF